MFLSLSVEHVKDGARVTIRTTCVEDDENSEPELHRDIRLRAAGVWGLPPFRRKSMSASRGVLDHPPRTNIAVVGFGQAVPTGVASGRVSSGRVAR